MKKLVLAIAVSGFLMAPVSYAVSFDDLADSPMKMQHSGKKLKKMARYLSLSDEQVEQIKAIRSESKTQSESLKASLKAFREQVKTEQTSDTFDEASFRASYAQYQETFAELALLKAKSRHAMAQVLSEEQQSKWQQFMEKRKAKYKEKRRARD